MTDYVVYHNPDTMGAPVTDVDALSVVTNKSVGDLRGSRIWLLTGEGRPRTFFVCSYFIVDLIESGSEEGFETRLSGTHGKVFDPMIILNDEDWFPDFKRIQGNFAFGLQPIKENRFVDGLEQAVAGR